MFKQVVDYSLCKPNHAIFCGPAYSFSLNESAMQISNM